MRSIAYFLLGDSSTGRRRFSGMSSDGVADQPSCTPLYVPGPVRPTAPVFLMRLHFRFLPRLVGPSGPRSLSLLLSHTLTGTSMSVKWFTQDKSSTHGIVRTDLRHHLIVTVYRVRSREQMNHPCVKQEAITDPSKARDLSLFRA
jgi:hypothetical protein